MRLKVLCESWNSQEQRPDADQDASFHILRPLRYPLPGCHELLTMTDQTKGRCYIAAQGLQRGDGNGQELCSGKVHFSRVLYRKSARAQWLFVSDGGIGFAVDLQISEGRGYRVPLHLTFTLTR